MIEVTLKEIVEGLQAIHALSQRRLPTKVGYWVGWHLKNMREYAAQFDETNKTKMQAEGEQVNNASGEPEYELNGNLKKIIPVAKRLAYNAEMNELLADKITIDKNKLKLSDFKTRNEKGELTQMEIEPEILSLLMWLIDNDIPD